MTKLVLLLIFNCSYISFILFYLIFHIESPLGSLFASDEENSNENDVILNQRPLIFNPYPIMHLGKTKIYSWLFIFPPISNLKSFFQCSFVLIKKLS